MSDAYPNICRISEAPVSWSHRARLQRVADAICRRTGLFCSFNRLGNSLLFHQTLEPFGGPLSLRAFHPDGQEKHYSDPEIDRAVEYVGVCRIDPKVKRMWEAQNKRTEDQHRRGRMDRYLDDVRPDAKSYAAYLDKRRRGVQRVSVAL